MQLDDVREQLHDLADHVPAGTVAVDSVLAHTRRTVKRKRIVARGIAAAAVVAVVVVAAVAIGTYDNDSVKLVVVAPTTIQPTPQTTNTQPTHTKIPFTDEQLRAHDGVGVPTDWAPVDEGDARVWVPKEWTLEPAGSCYGSSDFAGIVGLGKLPNVSCTPDDVLRTPREAVALIPETFPPPDPTASPGLPNANGYSYSQTPTPVGRAGWTYYDVPQLNITIAIHGALGPQILQTLAPSASSVALAYADQPVGNDYGSVEEEGVKVSLPPPWTVTTPQFFGCSQWFGASEPTLRIVKPGIGIPTCPFMFPTAETATHEGLNLFTDSQFLAPQPGKKPLAVLHHDATTITVYQGENDTDSLDLFVHLDGSSITHPMSLGLGRDGRVAGHVLASIQATT